MVRAGSVPQSRPELVDGELGRHWCRRGGGLVVGECSGGLSLARGEAEDRWRVLEMLWFLELDSHPFVEWLGSLVLFSEVCTRGQWPGGGDVTQGGRE